MLYKWTIQNCPDVKYVLKTDDDAFVDTFHLPKFLIRHKFDEKSNFFLCYVLKGYAPRRDKSDKWYVTSEEYNGEQYPPYCAGPVYVTKVKTMTKILSKLKNLNYLFIDDLLLTGIAAKGVTSHYDWGKSFLEFHIDSSDRLLSPKKSFYSPELLAAMDLNSTSILQLYKKSKKCHEHPNCYSLLNQIPIDSTRPKKVSKISNSKSEL